MPNARERSSLQRSAAECQRMSANTEGRARRRWMGTFAGLAASAQFHPYGSVSSEASTGSCPLTGAQGEEVCPLADAQWVRFSLRLRRCAPCSTPDQRRAPSPASHATTRDPLPFWLGHSLVGACAWVAWMVPGGGHGALWLCDRRGSVGRRPVGWGKPPARVKASGQRSATLRGLRGCWARLYIDRVQDV